MKAVCLFFSSKRTMYFQILMTSVSSLHRVYNAICSTQLLTLSRYTQISWVSIPPPMQSYESKDLGLQEKLDI